MKEIDVQIAYMSHEEDNPDWARACTASADAFAESVPATSTVLDIGCGDGLTLVRLRALGFQHLYGVDVSDAKLARARQKALDVENADLHHLPSEDAYFDAIHCRHVLEHAYDPPSALREMFRVLKPGGICYIVVPLPDRPDECHVGCTLLGTAGTDDPAAAVSHMETAGFQLVKVTSTGGVHGQEACFRLVKP